METAAPWFVSVSTSKAWRLPITGASFLCRRPQAITPTSGGRSEPPAARASESGERGAERNAGAVAVLTAEWLVSPVSAAGPPVR